MLNDIVNGENYLGTIGNFPCSRCGQYGFHQCSALYNYPQRIFIQEVLKMNTDKGEKAIKLAKELKDKKLVKVDTADQLLELLNILIKEL